MLINRQRLSKIRYFFGLDSIFGIAFGGNRILLQRECPIGTSDKRRREEEFILRNHILRIFFALLLVEGRISKSKSRPGCNPFCATLKKLVPCCFASFYSMIFFIFVYQFSNDIKNAHWNFEYLMHTLKNETNK